MGYSRDIIVRWNGPLGLVWEVAGSIGWDREIRILKKQMDGLVEGIPKRKERGRDRRERTKNFPEFYFHSVPLVGNTSLLSPI